MTSRRTAADMRTRKMGAQSRRFLCSRVRQFSSRRSSFRGGCLSSDRVRFMARKACRVSADRSKPDCLQEGQPRALEFSELIPAARSCSFPPTGHSGSRYPRRFNDIKVKYRKSSKRPVVNDPEHRQEECSCSKTTMRSSTYQVRLFSTHCQTKEGTPNRVSRTRRGQCSTLSNPNYSTSTVCRIRNSHLELRRS